MRRLSAAGAALLLAGVLAGSPGMSTAQTAGPWPTFHGTATRSGLSAGNGPTASTATNQWTLPQGLESSPVVDAAGNAYIGDDDGNVYALSTSKPAAPRWKFAAGGKVVGTPTLSGDGKTLYVGTTDGNVYAVDTSNGNKIWGPTLLTGRIQGSPLISADGSTLIIPTVDGSIHAVNASTGAATCSRPSGGAIQGSLTLSPDGATVYAATSNGVMFGIPASGSQVCTASGTAYYLTEEATSSPAVDANSSIYVASGTTQGKIMAFTPGSGTAQWTFPLTLGYTAPSTPAIGLGLVVFGSSDHHIYAISASSGTTVWNRPTGDIVESSPVIAGGNRMIYFGSDDGNVYAYDASGNLVWTRVTGAPVTGSPALGPDGSLWVASRSGAVYRIAALPTPPPPGTVPTSAATNTPTPTATTTTPPTATPTTAPAIKITLKLKSKVKALTKQSVKITGPASTAIHMRVNYPNGDHQSKTVKTNARGSATYSYVQGESKIRHNNFKATVIARVGSGAGQVTKTAKYTIQYGKIDTSVEPRTQSAGKVINVWVHTSARTRVGVTLLFPNKKFTRLSGTTGSNGWAHLKYKVGKGLTKGKNHKTTVAAYQASHTNVSTKTFFTIK